MHLTGLEAQVGGLLVLLTAAGVVWRSAIKPAVRGVRRMSGRLDQVLECTEQLPELVKEHRAQTEVVAGLVDRLGELRSTVSATARLSAVEDGKLAGRIGRLEDDQRLMWSSVSQHPEGVPQT